MPYAVHHILYSNYEIPKSTILYHIGILVPYYTKYPTGLHHETLYHILHAIHCIPETVCHILYTVYCVPYIHCVYVFSIYIHIYIYTYLFIYVFTPYIIKNIIHGVLYGIRKTLRGLLGPSGRAATEASAWRRGSFCSVRAAAAHLTTVHDRDPASCYIYIYLFI